MRPSLLDLFGEIPITTDEIEVWIDVVPGWPRTLASRRRYYAEAWNVADKIRAAKESGFWQEVEARKADQLASVGAQILGGSSKPHRSQ